MYDIIVASKGNDTGSFALFKEEHPYAVWLPGMGSIWHAMREARRMALTDMFWLVTDDLFDCDHSGVDFAWKPPEFDRTYPHRWQARETNGDGIEGFHGLYLLPRTYEVTDEDALRDSPANVKEMDGFGITAIPFDVVFAARDPEQADQRHESMLGMVPRTKLLTCDGNIVSAMREAARLSTTQMYWLATDELFETESMDLDLSWKPVPFDRRYPHRCVARSSKGVKLDGFRGLYLMPKFYDVSDKEVLEDSLDIVKDIDEFDIVTKPFSMFFISYDEKYADRHYGLLKKRFPEIRRVHGIDGIANAHRRCAELSDTAMFWTIDADSIVDASFDFSYRPLDYDRKYLHVWHTRNPVNGLEYGWGAVKLWPKELVMSHEGNYLDYTTSLGRLKVMEDVVATSAFNSDPFKSWRSGFREAVKLARNARTNDDTESLKRLHAWCTIAKRVAHASDARIGANDGLWYYLNGNEMLAHINDFDWLREVYLDRAQRITRDWDAKDMSIGSLLTMLGVDADA